MKRQSHKTRLYLLLALASIVMIPMLKADWVSAEPSRGDAVIEDTLITEDIVLKGDASVGDNDELFSHYIESKLYQTRTETKSKSRKSRKASLTGINSVIYNQLKEQIKPVADGLNTSTVFTVELEDLGLENESWTAKDLGVSTIAVGGEITQEAKKALAKKLDIDMNQILTELLFDCPYDLYWYDKEQGIHLSGPSVAARPVNNPSRIYLTSGIIVSFTVADGYSTGNQYEVDSSKAEKVNHAVAKAQELVQAAGDKTDHDKLTDYKKAICDLVTYDSAAAYDWSVPYGDPWQIISVFDENDDTNVVCEGYAKALQYLCDLTDFEGHITCLSVSGVMYGSTTSGPHMWNILCMGNGENYLADLTNCDDDSEEGSDLLFMAGYLSGDVTEGYTFESRTGTIKYCYDSDSTDTFDTELVIVPKGTCCHNLIRTDGVTPTYTEDGNIPYWTCDLCGKVFSDADAKNEITQEDTVIPADQKREIDSVYRIYGSTRYETSLKVAEDLKKKLGIHQFDSVILAYGKNYADALAGSYLSSVSEAPILLLDSGKDHIDAVQSYIKANLKKGGKIYMLGGSAVVPDSVVSDLSDYEAVRLGGKDRYETNVKILEEAEKLSDASNEYLICSGTGFADSLSASAVGKPIILVKTSVQNSQKSYINSLQGKSFYLIGGTGAVNEKMESVFKKLGTTKRIGGATRYETSVNVAKKFFKTPKAAILAYGNDFPDGLCGGALAHAVNCPLILVVNGKTSFAEAYADENNIHVGAVLGGPALISDTSVELVFGWKPFNPDTAVRHNISYELKGGTNAPANPDQYPEGKKLTLADPAYDNHSFCGWYLDSQYTQRVTAIEPTSKEDITLYAKWHLAALNIAGEGMDDMIWSWWYYPQVISNDANDIFWGYATKDGHCGVAKYDHATDKVTKTAMKLANADDHNGLALTLLNDGKVMAVYAGGHNTDNEIHVRISDDAQSIDSFSKDIVLESGGKTCYSQIIKSNGRYYLFYRVNNSKWAYRYSSDCLEWSDETILVTAPMQYYCRFSPTTDDHIIRILMYSNPSESAPEIRMGFFDTNDNSVYDGSGFPESENVIADSVKLPSSKNAYTLFNMLQSPPDGKTQRLFDCAVTEPAKPEFLYSIFTKKTGSNDSIYYVYDSGSSLQLCEGGAPLMDYKYQLGASFIDASTIVSARNTNGTDHVELYNYEGNTVNLIKTLDSQTGIRRSRNARPISDVNGKAILWHNGYYNNNKYTDFDTSARMYLPDSDRTIMAKSDTETISMDHTEFISVDKNLAENVYRVNTYADKLYNENIKDDYKTAEFTWSQEHHKRGWLYYNGFMLEALLTADATKYSPEILNYYDQHTVLDNSTGKYKIWQYVDGELDWALPATGMIDMIYQGIAVGDRADKYAQAINYVYNQLEHQTMYEDAGKLWQHSERETQTEVDGEIITTRVPTKAWTKWNICLDGVYMSNLFLVRLAEAMDAGMIEIYSESGSLVNSNDLWNDIYTRMSFVMENMRNPKTGLLYHGYSVESKECNGVIWSRGLGWFTMALLDAAEKMPDESKQSSLAGYYESLMSSIIEWQDPDTCLWYNVVDRNSDLNKNQPETSGTAMFAYCLLKGYHSGLLKDEEYREAGLKAFNSMAENKLTDEGLTDTLIGMGCTSVPEHYNNNAYVTNEAKGISALIMAAKYAY